MGTTNFDSLALSGDFEVTGNLAVSGKSTLNSYVLAEGATITVGAEATNVITVAVQLTDGAGADLANVAVIPFYLSTDAAGDTPASTAPNAGLAAGTDGTIIEWTANLSGMAISEADGDIDFAIGDSGTPTFYLVLCLPTGKRVVSGAITFA